MLIPCSTGRCVVGSVVKNAPNPLPVFTGRGGGAFFVFLIACMVPLKAG